MTFLAGWGLARMGSLSACPNTPVTGTRADGEGGVPRQLKATQARGGPMAELLRDCFARAAELLGEVLELGQAVPDGQHGLGIVDVHAGLEAERRQGGGEAVDQPELRMVGHQVPAALGTVLALAELGLGVGRDMLHARRDAN